MSLVGQWEDLEAELASGWGEARLQLTLEEPTALERASTLLAPAQPFQSEPDVLSFRVARDGKGQSSGAVRRLLRRLDAERLHGTLIVVASSEVQVVAVVAPAATLPESWAAALATVPGDWSDLLGEVELSSSDYLERAALLLCPINPRRVGTTLALQFRSASKHGYGASAGMVGRCLERCENDGIRGTVRVLRVLSDTHPVATQGPVWQIDGRTV